MPTSVLESLRGARTPRVSYHPPYTQTFGPEAVELAASCGLPLEPWQAEGLDPMLATRADGRWVCFECAEIVSRQNGKSYLGEARVLAGLYLLGERLIMWSAHRYATAMESFRHLRTVIDADDDLRRRIKSIRLTTGEESVELHGEGRHRITGEQRLRFLARTAQTGRGFSGEVNIIDEALLYTNDQQAALMPTMSAQRNPQVLYLSSPPMESDGGEILYRLRARGEAGEDPALSWRDWGVAGDLANLDAIDLDDPALWAAANPAMGGRLTAEFVARERASMSPRDFARERLGVWPPAPATIGSGVIAEGLWLSRIDASSSPGPDIAIAVDIEPNRRNSSIAIYGPRADGKGHVELVAYRPGTAWLVPALARLKQLHNPVAVGVDAKGPAGSLLPKLAAAGIAVPASWDEPARGDLAVPQAADVAAAWAQFLDAVTDEELFHLDQAPLTAAVGNAKTRQIGDAVALARRTATGDISPLVAATLARWAYVTRVEKIVRTIEPEAWWV